MNTQQMARLDALRRVNLFLHKHSKKLGGVATSASRVRLQQCERSLQALGAEQEAARTESHGRTKMKNAARAALRLHMKPIAAIAAAHRRELTTIQDLRLPFTSFSDAALVAAGVAMVQATAEHKKTFIDEGLHETFGAQLEDAVRQFTESTQARNLGQLRLVAATRAIAQELAFSAQSLRVVHALVCKYARSESGILAGWESARRKKARPGRLPGKNTNTQTETQ